MYFGALRQEPGAQKQIKIDRLSPLKLISFRKPKTGNWKPQRSGKRFATEQTGIGLFAKILCTDKGVRLRCKGR